MKRPSHFLFFLFFIYFKCDVSNADCPNIISKLVWGGRQNSQVDRIIIPVGYVIVEHTVSQECNTLTMCSERVANIQHYHINSLRYHDIGYNFLIGGDGNIYEGVGWHRVGAHARGWNTRALGIAFIGDFSDKLPPPMALEALRKLLQCGVEVGELDTSYKLLGHRQVIATLSPGTRLFQEISTWPHFTLDINN